MKRTAHALTGILPFLLIASVVSIMSSCGGSSTTSTAGGGANSYYGTQSPGDAWSWEITKDAGGNGSFSATNKTSGSTYSGSVATLSSKFLQLTIAATTDSNVTVGNIEYAVEFPDTALIVKPAGVKDALVIGAAQGDSPSPASYNWVKVANLGWDVSTDPAFGTATSTESAGTFTMSVVPYLLGSADPMSTVIYTGVFSNGVITTTAADGTTFGVTPSGVLIGDQGTNGGLIGMLQPTAKIGSTAILQAGREFRGFVFMTHPPFESGGITLQDKTQGIWSRTKGDGLITAGEYTNFANGTEDSDPGGSSIATLSLDSEAAPGEFAGTMTDSHAGTHPFTLMINQINGKYMIFGFSQNQWGSGNNMSPYLFVVMEQ
jgi:hypothetical protein